MVKMKIREAAQVLGAGAIADVIDAGGQHGDPDEGEEVSAKASHAAMMQVGADGEARGHKEYRRSPTTDGDDATHPRLEVEEMAWTAGGGRLPQDRVISR